MKKFFAVLPLLFAAIAFVSCEKEENYGYPSTVLMSAAGETVELCGSSEYPFIQHIEILDYDGDGNGMGYGSDDEEFLSVTTGWLTVESPRTENIILSSAPNTSGKKRKLFIYLSCGGSRQEIKVIQNR